MTYLQKLTFVFELHIQQKLLEKFSIVFDGLCGGGSHYFSLYEIYPAPEYIGYDMVLVARSTMENENSLDAHKQYEFMKFVLTLFCKSMDYMVAMAGDNWNKNRAMSRRIGPIFVSCHSHRFNLAVKDII